MRLIYVGDPMCSWCYGFGKELSELLKRRRDLEIEIVVGGVSAGTTEVLSDTERQFRLQHWSRVEALSGLPFDRAAFVARQLFIYDTEPVCRAVVTARRLIGNEGLLNVFRALQHAFYAKGQDTTNEEILAEVAVGALSAAGARVRASDFLEDWASSQSRRQTQSDFAVARALGVRSFPTLLLEGRNYPVTVSSGYAPANELQRRLEQIEPQAA
ncbi:DsbA family protein [Caballeronia sp. GAFFF1]|uniref:DsbA family protein n=1 Tax=Caballeronia sp. GAFFF1 TaxID=2921779 RepID=UPI002028CC76|nr:DsbA family protein [Caballeronia sp. GAFFF1]